MKFDRIIRIQSKSPNLNNVNFQPTVVLHPSSSPWISFILPSLISGPGLLALTSIGCLGRVDRRRIAYIIRPRLEHPPCPSSSPFPLLFCNSLRCPLPPRAVLAALVCWAVVDRSVQATAPPRPLRAPTCLPLSLDPHPTSSSSSFFFFFFFLALVSLAELLNNNPD